MNGMIKSKTVYAGLALIGQGIYPALDATSFQDAVGKVNWPLVANGFAVIFVRHTLHKTHEKVTETKQ